MAVRQLPTDFPNLYERNGLILHSWNSRGRANISPASRHRTAHSSRLRYWSNLAIFPSHSLPDELEITTTFGTSHGPTQPLMVSWTRLHRSPIPPFILQPFHRDFWQTALDIAATTASTDRNLADHETLRSQRTISMPVHRASSAPASKTTQSNKS